MLSPTRPYRVLLCASGMSPAIITETLYALAVSRAEPFYPDEIHVVTTTEGRKKIEQDLLQTNGPLDRLLTECWPSDRKRPRFDQSTIHVIRGQADVNSEQSNKLAGDCIFQTFLGIQQGSLLRGGTRRPGNAPHIHASIAGGRKTMSFLMGHVFSLLAGPDDELSHVLVNEPFEAVRPTFFFPPKNPQTHTYIPRGQSHGIENKPTEIGSDQARVELGLITALKLGNQWMPTRWVQCTGPHVNFDMAVRLANAQLKPEPIRLMLSLDRDTDKTRSHVQVCGHDIELPVAEFSLLAIYALVKQQARHCPGGDVLNVTALPPAFWHSLPSVFEDKRKKFSAFSESRFKTTNSRLGATLTEHIGGVAKHCLIAPVGYPVKNAHRPYRLMAQAELIEFDGDGPHAGWESEWWRPLHRFLQSAEGKKASDPAWKTDPSKT